MPAVQHILFPYDCTERGAEIAAQVRALAHRFDARVTVFGVVPPTYAPVTSAAYPHVRTGEDMGAWKRHLQSELDQSFNAEFAGLRVDRTADAGDPAIRIVDFAREHDVDLIMMPTRGAGPFRSMLIGSVTAKVLHDASCPVWTSAHAESPTASELPRQMLCAVDGSPQTPELIRWTSELAATLGARLSLIHVVGPVSDWPALESERRLQEQARATAQARIQTMVSSSGSPIPLQVDIGEIVPTVTDAARRTHADLVVIGRGQVGEPFGRLRTHAFGIIQRSPCPVLSH